MLKLESRIYEMYGRFYYDALLNGYFMAPGERGIKHAGTWEVVPGSEHLTCHDLGSFADSLRFMLAKNPKALP